jgi:hypothetical protein
MHWPAKPRPFTGLLDLYPHQFHNKKTSVVTVHCAALPIPFSATIIFRKGD